MPQQICPNCQTSNPFENRFCGNCGTSLARSYAMVPSRPLLPVPTQRRWQSLAQAPVIQAATVSLGALAFRFALAWLRRRYQRRKFSYGPNARIKTPSRVIFEPEQDQFTRRSRPWRIITLAWWSVRVEEPVIGFEAELKPPK